MDTKCYMRLQHAQFHPIYHLTFDTSTYTFMAECGTTGCKSPTQTFKHNLSKETLNMIKASSSNDPWSRIKKIIDISEQEKEYYTELEEKMKKVESKLEAQKNQIRLEREALKEERLELEAQKNRLRETMESIGYWMNESFHEAESSC